MRAKSERPKLGLVTDAHEEAQRLEELQALNRGIRERVEEVMEMVEEKRVHAETLSTEFLLELVRGVHHIEGYIDERDGYDIKEFYKPIMDELNRRIREVFFSYVPESSEEPLRTAISQITLNENYPWSIGGDGLILYLPRQYRFLLKRLCIPGVMGIDIREDLFWISIDPLTFPFVKRP